MKHLDELVAGLGKEVFELGNFYYAIDRHRGGKDYWTVERVADSRVQGFALKDYSSITKFLMGL